MYAMAEKAEEAIWTTGEVRLNRDPADWDKLTSDQRYFLENVLAFFAASDGIVIENLGQRFMSEVKAPEARYFYGIQVGMETVHSKMYSILISTYVRDTDRRNALFNAIETMPCVKEKADWALQYIQSETASFGTRILAFACVEGIFFSSSFAAIYFVKTLSLLPGLTQSNELIARDEGLHTEFAVLLYTHYLKGKLTQDEVHKIVSEVVDIECRFVCEGLPVSLLGMNQDLMCQYVHYVADRLLLSLGYDKIWEATNPFPFMDNISTETKTNFFERRVTEYKHETKKEEGFAVLDDF